jgi:hypothetical protein
MPAYRRIISTFRSLFRKEELDRDVDEELASYLALLTAEKVRAGMSPEEARREARVELGGVEQVKEKVREKRVGAMIDTLFQDVRYAIRTLKKNAGFTVVAVLILAMGIGATTALFSTIDTALLSSLPFQEPGRLVVGRKTWDGVMSGPVSRVDYFDYREYSRSFEELAALADFTVQHTVMGERRPELVEAGYVTWNLFRALGTNPVVGRHFLPEEEIPGSAGVTLISYGFWQSRFGGTPDAVGSTLNLDGSPLTVVGVMPRGFRFLLEADLWRLVDRDGPFDLERDSHSHFVAAVWSDDGPGAERDGCDLRRSGRAVPREQRGQGVDPDGTAELHGAQRPPEPAAAHGDDGAGVAHRLWQCGRPASGAGGAAPF